MRSFSANQPVQLIPGLGPKTTVKLAEIGIQTILDLLLHIPRDYQDFSQAVTISTAATLAHDQPKTKFSLLVNIGPLSSYPMRGRRLFRHTATAIDDTGRIRLTWFGPHYLKTSLPQNTVSWVSGTIKLGPGEIISMSQPVITKTPEALNPEAINEIEDSTRPGLTPVYRLPAGITQKQFRHWLNQVLPPQDLPHGCPDNIFPELPSFAQAIQLAHQPTDQTDISRAHRRLAMDELVTEQLILQTTDTSRQHPGFAIPADTNHLQQAVAKLPFQLTPGQKRAVWDIAQDMATGQPMHRLLEGDVGSGKTLVAELALSLVFQVNCRAIFVAPTEILARQLYHNCCEFFGDKQDIALLIGGQGLTKGQKMTRKATHQAWADGEFDLLIGTHAIFHLSAHPDDVALVIIDEQHRFGVRQRATPLAQLPHQPHLLTMSATPIPRTLAQSYFADLSISKLTDKPIGRQPIQTSIISPDKKPELWANIISNHINHGQQVFVVTSLVEDSELNERNSAISEAARLQATHPQLKVGVVHGRLNSSDKDEVMQAFRDHKLQVLVATSVIEIGVNIPNANVMIIEGAEQFGLAQLHQLRGRVGRGNTAAFCYLIPTTNDHLKNSRLKALVKSHNGFELAEMDMRLRGFGALFGELQSGYHYRFGQYVTPELILNAKHIAKQILAEPQWAKKYPDTAAAIVAHRPEVILS